MESGDSSSNAESELKPESNIYQYPESGNKYCTKGVLAQFTADLGAYLCC